MDYAVRRQLTIALENTPGRLAGVTASLAQNGINIEALSITDSVEQGVIRLVTNDPSACRAMLLRQGVGVVDTEVLSLELTDAPGRLSQIARAMADAGVNIDYAYASVLKAGERTRLILKVTPLAKARQVLDGLKD
jgi:hypothetical protein